MPDNKRSTPQSGSVDKTVYEYHGNEYEALIGTITDVATRWFVRDGKLVMTKVVGGILAIK